MPLDPTNLALSVVNQIPAMVAYWDSEQRCVFANRAYQEWFGRSPEQMKGISLRELLGPLYEKNLPYILRALGGEKQVFERQIPLATGEVRETIATYTPHVVDGVVRGFSVHVADVTLLRERESALERAIQDRDRALKEVRALRGMLPICANCKAIRDKDGIWHQIEFFIISNSEAKFSHGVCPKCAKIHYGEFLREGI